MKSVRDVTRHHEAVNETLKCFSHETRRIEVSTIAYGVLEAIDKVRLSRSHQSGEFLVLVH
jgi:hypothetical protein